MTEQIEALPFTKSSTKTPAAADRLAKHGLTKGRGRPGTADCKMSRKTPIHHLPIEEKMKKKGSYSVLKFSDRKQMLLQCVVRKH